MIGKMRHRISVYEVLLGENNGFEEPIRIETLRFETWASIKQISRKDAVKSNLDEEVGQFEVTIRSALDNRVITKSDKVVWNGDKYNVRTSPTKVNLENREYFQFIITKGS